MNGDEMNSVKRGTREHLKKKTEAISERQN
jgi:hypothetical protein